MKSKMEKLRTTTLLVLILLCHNLYSNDYDSLFYDKVIELENSLDSIQQVLIENEKRTIIIESELGKYSDTLQNPIQLTINKSIWESVANFFAIILSIVTLIYVAKADKINTLFGSYRGKKRHQTLEKEIGDLTIKLKDVKSEFDELINAHPESFIKNGELEIARLQKIANRIDKSNNFTYPGDIELDSEELIYKTPDGVYKFNNYVTSRIEGCNQTIYRIETELKERTNEARVIRFGENNSTDL